MFKKILEFNKVILTMVVVDFFIIGAFSTISPFFAIFVIQDIRGGTATVAGFAAAIYWITKSIFQLPISRWLDRTDGERDEFNALFFSYLVSAFIPIIYFFSFQPWHIYVAQALLGFIFAWAVPAWYSIFTRHLDKFRISFEWSLFSVSVGVSAALAASGAGLLVDYFGFRAVFILASAIILLSSFGLLNIRNKIFSKKTFLEKVIPEKKSKVYAGH